MAFALSDTASSFFNLFAGLFMEHCATAFVMLVITCTCLRAKFRRKLGLNYKTSGNRKFTARNMKMRCKGAYCESIGQFCHTVNDDRRKALFEAYWNWVIFENNASGK